ncbi:hypothetical protein E4U59_002939 [Claviceps monticola]|nr:hypothetical protein E4U59_002939 [Claviceps monticola]
MVRPTLIISLVAAAYAAVAVANKLPGAYIVELEDGHDHAAVLDHISGEASTRRALDSKVFRGLSFQCPDIEAAGKRAEQIPAMPAMKKMWPVIVISKKTIGNVRVVGMPQDSKAVKRSDSLPKDNFAPHVAVIDGGIDYTQPALGGCFGQGCLVSFGTDLVGDDFDGYNDPVPDDDPMDNCDGHGTHVACIIAAQQNPLGFTGAAPGVTLRAYRVFGCAEAAANDIIIDAPSKAFGSGANIITTSIGMARGWGEEPWAVTASRIVERGVPVTVSAGNDGDSGLFLTSAGAEGKGVIAVASFDSTEEPVISFHSSGREIDFLYTPGDLVTWGSSISMLLYATSLDYRVDDDSCESLPVNTPDFSKYIVLVRRGGCTFDDKLSNLVAKGAQYVMFYNDKADMMVVTPDNPSAVKATGMVTYEIGIDWVKLL